MENIILSFNVVLPLFLCIILGYFLRRIRMLVISLLGKLVLSPFLMLILGILVGFRNETLVPILVMFGAPTAVSSFPMAQQMEGDGDLAASVVVFTSGLS